MLHCDVRLRSRWMQVHEDEPDKVADIIVNFLARNKMIRRSAKTTQYFTPSC